MKAKYILILITVMTSLVTGCTEKSTSSDLEDWEMQLEQEKLNNIQSEYYKNAIPITQLKVENCVFIINNESRVTQPGILTIPDDAEPRYVKYNKSYESCDSNIIIGDKQCVTTYKEKYTFFVNREAFRRIHSINFGCLGRQPSYLSVPTDKCTMIVS